MGENKKGTVINGQTCLEKRGIDERYVEIERNLYNNRDLSNQYSSSHPNATSEPDSVKGKGRNGSGHIHSLPYTGTPKTSLNEINYRNFITVSTDGATIGGKYDIDTRYESEVRSLFKRDINEYSVTNENAISDGNVHGKGTGVELDTANGGGGYDVIQRDDLIRKNFYNNLDPNNNYSSVHENALSTPYYKSPFDSKGKGTGGSGHLHFTGYYGKPRGDKNKINYSNFNTFADKSNTIGNKADTDTRYNLALISRYNRETNVYSSTNEDAISNGDIIGKGTGLFLDTNNGGGAYDIIQRDESIRLNTWRREDAEYSKALVLTEYEIQTEFKVSTMEERTSEIDAKRQAEAIARSEMKAERDAEKQRKREEKRKRKEEKKNAQNVKGTDAQPDDGKKFVSTVEAIVPAKKQSDGIIKTYLNIANDVVSQLSENSNGLHNWANDELRRQ